MLMHNKVFLCVLFRENEWKPAGIFSTLGERERDRSLLEAKKAQWRKELGG